MTAEICAACGRTIRNDETPQIVSGSIVCPKCADGSINKKLVALPPRPSPLKAYRGSAGAMGFIFILLGGLGLVGSIVLIYLVKTSVKHAEYPTEQGVRAALAADAADAALIATFGFSAVASIFCVGFGSLLRAVDHIARRA